MSDHTNTDEHIIAGQDNVPVCDLYDALANCMVLVSPNVEGVLVSNKDATKEDWEKFYATINKLNVPVTSLIEGGAVGNHPRVSGATVIAAITLAIDIAQKLWDFFKDFDDKNVGCTVSASAVE